MQSSPLLPPPASGPADVAAPLPGGHATVDEAGGESFGAVLESRLAAVDSSSAVAESQEPATEMPEGDAAQPALADAVLAALNAGLAPGAPFVSPAIASHEESHPGGGGGLKPTELPADVRSVVPGTVRVSGQAVADVPWPGAGSREETVQVSLAEGANGQAASANAARLDAALAPAVAGGANAPAEGATNVPRMPVPARFGSAAWGDSFSDRVTWIAQARQPTAELTLNPPQLGPVEIRVSVSPDQQASLSFLSPHPGVREAIQGSLPRLQEAFAASGLQLSEVFVGSGAADHGRDQEARHGARDDAPRAPAVRGGPDPSPLASITWLRGGSLGQVDLFA